MSSLTAAMAAIWSGVSTYGNDASSSICHGESAEYAWPLSTSRAAYSASRSLARACTTFRTRAFARCHSPLASLVRCGWRSDGLIAAYAVELVCGNKQLVLLGVLQLEV